MKPPTILSDANIRTGSTGPESTPLDFGAQTAAAVQDLSRSFDRVDVGISEYAKMQREEQHLADLTWAGQSAEQEKAYVNKWMADPANNSKETYADDLQTLTKQRLAVYDQAAKNPRARLMFRQHFLPFMSERYESALNTTAKTKLNNAALGIDQQSGDAMDGYRQSLSVPGVDAGKTLMDSLDHITGNIDKTFGTIAPTLAQKLKEKVVVDATYAAMTHDPSLATRILNTSKTLDEHTRFIIQNHIDTAMRSKDTVEEEAFKRYRQDQVAAVSLGKARNGIPLTMYESYYPKDTAAVMKMRDDDTIDMLNRSNDFYDKVKGWNSAQQTAELSKLSQSAANEEDRQVLQHVSDRIRQNIQLQERNPVSWQQQNNPVVKDALDRAIKSTDTQRMPMLRELYDMQLKFQGYPTKDDATTKLEWVHDPYTGYEVAKEVKNTVDAKQFLNLPTNARHLMTVEEAEEAADKVNQGSPKQALQSITEIMQRYPDEKYQNIAFNDMVTLPKAGKAIKQEYQLAFLNQGASWVDSYLGAVGNSQAVKDIQPDKRADFDKALNVDKNWVAFSHSMMGDNFQRGKQVDGFRNGLLTYAYARAAQTGESPTLAVRVATEQLLHNELGFASVNGQTMMVMRNPGVGKPYRTDHDVSVIGRNLELSLQFIDPKSIKLEDEHGRMLFPGLTAAGTPERRMQAIRDAITMSGTFQTSADGQSATLYYHDQNNHFELRDQKNNAFRIMFDDVQDPWMFGGVGRYGKVSVDDPWGVEIPKDPETGLPITHYGAIMNAQGSLLTLGLGHKARSYPLMTDQMTNWPTIKFIQRVPR